MLSDNTIAVFMRQINILYLRAYCLEPMFVGNLRAEANRDNAGTQHEPKNTRRLTHHLGRCFEKYDLLFVPICDHENWTLLTVDIKAGKVEYFEPSHLFSKARDHEELLCAYIKDDFDRRADVSKRNVDLIYLNVTGGIPKTIGQS